MLEARILLVSRRGEQALAELDLWLAQIAADVVCQWRPKLPQLWRRKIPQPAGLAISRMRDQRLCFLAVFAAFADLEMIAGDCVRSWTRRQFKSDSSTERVRKHREAKRSGELMRGQAVELSPPCRKPAEASPPDESPLERYETPPYSYSDPKDLNPSLPLEAGREPSGGFERFWRAMPSPNPAAKAATARYANAFAAMPTTHPISLARFLRERCFEGYGPPTALAEAPAVFVRVDTPQWRAWTAHRGRPIPLNREGTGWHFPSEWPSAERGAA